MLRGSTRFSYYAFNSVIEESPRRHAARESDHFICRLVAYSYKARIAEAEREFLELGHQVRRLVDGIRSPE